MALTNWTNAVEWLAAAAREPRLCKSDWQHGTTGIHLLAAGRFWDVLVVPACLGLRTADILACLPACLPACLASSPARHCWTADDGRSASSCRPTRQACGVGNDIRYLTTGSWIATPAPHCRWGDLRWICPPDGSGTLNTPAALELALHAAMGELARNHGTTHHRAAPHRSTDTPTPATPTRRS